MAAIVPQIIVAVAAAFVSNLVSSLLSEPTRIRGPRLNDKNVQASTYGIPIPIVRGTVRCAGNVIWSAGIREVATEQDAGGGKGGKGGGSEITTYTYFCTLAVSLCVGEISAVRRIWGDGQLIYDAAVMEQSFNIPYVWMTVDGVKYTDYSGAWQTAPYQAYVPDPRAQWAAQLAVQQMLDITVYPGNETQLQDPTMTGYVGDVPAYRGQAYVVIRDMALQKFGNRIPNLTFEIVEAGAQTDPVTTYSPVGGLRFQIVYDPILNEIWQYLVQAVPADPYMVRINAQTGAIVGYVYPLTPTFHSVPGTVNWTGNPIYDIYNNTIYMSDTNGNFVAIDAASGVEIGATTLPGYATGWEGPVMDYVSGNLWYYNIGSLDFMEVSRETGAAVRTVWAGGRRLTDMDSDDNSGGLWITMFSPFDDGTVARSLYRIDATGFHPVYTHTAALGVLCYDFVRNVLHIALDGTANTIVYDVALHAQVGGYTLAQPPSSVMYDPIRDLIVWTRQTTGIEARKAGDGSPYKTVALEFNGAYVVSGKDGLYTASGASSAFTDWSLSKIRFDIVSSESVPLADIVHDICERAGLQDAQINASALTDDVDGYLITRQDPARSCLEELAAGFLFEGVESDDKVKFVKLGHNSVVTIGDDELAAHEHGAKLPDLITVQRAQDVELPEKINVNYSSVALNYEVNTQQAERLSGIAPVSGRIQTIALPIVMSDDYARALADAFMFNAWTARTAYKFQTSAKYSEYEPTDVMSVHGAVLRVVGKGEGGGVLTWEGVAEDPDLYTQIGVGAAGSYAAQVIRQQSVSYFLPLDTVLLRDSDNAPGFYAAVGGYQATWRGAVLYRSNDGGTTYLQQRAFTNLPAVGTALNTLGDFAGGNIFDELNTLTVAIYAEAELVSVTRLAVLNGINAAALDSSTGWEILQFRNAVLNADGTYTLSGLLRGRKGSEFAMAHHATGNRFALLTPVSVGDIQTSSADFGIEHQYKPVSISSLLLGTPPTEFTNTGVRLKPLAPVHVGGGRNASGDVLIDWMRRSRVSGEWRDGVDVPLGEASELYDVEIWDVGYATLKRTFADLTAENATYTAAQQTTDFGGLQSAVYVTVYQKSAIVGRGFAARATL